MTEQERPRRVSWRSGAATDTDRAVRIAAWTWTAVGALILAAALLYLLWRPLLVIIPPLLLAGLVVYLLDPAVTRMSGRGVPRWLATALLYLAFIAVGGALVTAVAPVVAGQGEALAQQAPDLRQRGVDLLNRAGESAGLNLSLGGTEGTEEIAEEVVRETGEAMEDDASRQRMMTVLAGLGGVAAGAAKLLLLLALGPVLAFYLLADLPRIRSWTARAAPPARRQEVSDLMAALSSVVGGYVRGQLLIALFVGVFTSAGLALIGLPFWLVVGIVAGLTNLIPFVGPFIGGALGVGLALLTGGWGMAAWVVVVVVVVQQAESQVLQPLIMRRTVSLHPAVVVLALLAAGATYGIAGMLLAVPAVAALKVLGEYLWRRHVPWAAEPDLDAVKEAAGVEVETLSS